MKRAGVTITETRIRKKQNNRARKCQTKKKEMENRKKVAKEKLVERNEKRERSVQTVLEGGGTIH